MEGNDSRPFANILLVVTVILLIWTTLFAVVRIWVRSQQQWQQIDGVFIAGYVLAASQCAATIFFAVVLDGRSNLDWQKPSYAGHILYVCAFGASRCSTALFLKSLTRDIRQNQAGIFLAVVPIFWTVASVLAIAIREEMSRPWKTAEYARWVGVETSGLVIEALHWTFAFLLIWRLNVRVRRRVKLLLIFAIRLLLVPVIAIRLRQLKPSTHEDTFDRTVMTSLLAQIAMHFSLIAECLTCMKPFLQTYYEGAVAKGDSSHYWGELTNFSQQPSKGSSGKQKQPRVVQQELSSGRRRSSREEVVLRSDKRASLSTKITFESRAQGDDRMEDDIELLPPSKIRVQRTTTMSES